MSTGLRIELADLKPWLQEGIAPIVNPLKNKGNDLLSEIKSRLRDVQENGDRIFVKSEKEAEKGSPKTYRCAKAANKMSKNVLNIVDQIAVPNDVSYESLKSLLKDLEKAFVAIERERRVWYPRISPYFILDRKRLDIAIRRAEDSIRELRGFLLQDYVKTKTVENALAMIDRLSRLTEKAESYKKQRIQTEKRIKSLEDKIQETLLKIGSTKDKAELSELSRLEQRIRDLREKVKYNLRHLQKPFYKLQSLARSAQVALPPEEAKKLEKYLDDPFEAITSEKEGYPILKRILQRVNNAIRQGKLKLKPARLRKAQDQMESILKKDVLNPLQRNCIEAVLRRNQLLISETVTTTQKELEHLQTLLQDLQRERESADSKRKSLIEEHKRLLEKIETQKNELEKSIFKITGKRVQVVL
jgi:hypothetical protein